MARGMPRCRLRGTGPVEPQRGGLLAAGHAAEMGGAARSACVGAEQEVLEPSASAGDAGWGAPQGRGGPAQEARVACSWELGVWLGGTLQEMWRAGCGLVVGSGGCRVVMCCWPCGGGRVVRLEVGSRVGRQGTEAAV